MKFSRCTESYEAWLRHNSFLYDIYLSQTSNNSITGFKWLEHSTGSKAVVVSDDGSTSQIAIVEINIRMEPSCGHAVLDLRNYENTPYFQNEKRIVKEKIDNSFFNRYDRTIIGMKLLLSTDQRITDVICDPREPFLIYTASSTGIISLWDYSNHSSSYVGVSQPDMQWKLQTSGDGALRIMTIDGEQCMIVYYPCGRVYRFHLIRRSDMNKSGTDDNPNLEAVYNSTVKNGSINVENDSLLICGGHDIEVVSMLTGVPCRKELYKFPAGQITAVGATSLLPNLNAFGCSDDSVYIARFDDMGQLYILDSCKNEVIDSIQASMDSNTQNISGVVNLRFHPLFPNLLLVGYLSGAVAIWKLGQGATCKFIHYGHTGDAGIIEWFPIDDETKNTVDCCTVASSGYIDLLDTGDATFSANVLQIWRPNLDMLLDEQ